MSLPIGNVPDILDPIKDNFPRHRLKGLPASRNQKRPYPHVPVITSRLIRPNQMWQTLKYVADIKISHTDSTHFIELFRVSNRDFSSPSSSPFSEKANM